MRKTHFHLATSLVGLLAFTLFLSGCSSGDDPETPPDKLITVEIPATQTSLLFHQTFQCLFQSAGGIHVIAVSCYRSSMMVAIGNI